MSQEERNRLQDEALELDKQAAGLEADARAKRAEAANLRTRRARLPAPPVDYQRRAVIGEAVAPGEANTEPKASGQQKGYVVLSDEERMRGFVRDVRDTYTHEKCGHTTTMSRALAETYARAPDFYSGTFCCHCGSHFPVGAGGQFVWTGTSEKVGT